MEFTDIASYVNYIRLAVLVLVAVIAAIAAMRRARPKAAKRDLANGIALVLVVLVMGIVGSATGWLYVAVFLVAGLVVGFLLGSVRPFVAWVSAFAQVYFAMALLWDAGGYFAAGLAVLAFAAGMSLAQSFRTRGAPSSASADAGAIPTLQPQYVPPAGPPDVQAPG